MSDDKITSEDAADIEGVVINLAERLAEMDPLEYEKRRKDTAKNMGVRVSALDKVVDKLRPTQKINGSGNTLDLPEPELWPEPVDGDVLLNALCAVFYRYLALADGAAEAMALWVIHTHALGATTITPRLAITSPEKRCGKTTALSVLQHLVRKPLPASNITAAALFRTIEMAEPTLMIDEADTFLKGNDELRGILNSGHNKFSAHVIRTTGDDHEPRMFATWAPVAIAMIGRLPGTLEDRSIVIQMRRKRSDEIVTRFRQDQVIEINDLTGKCARFVADNWVSLSAADPDIPNKIHDRAADNWRPLFAIADAAGGGWPELSRKVALKLTAADEDADSVRAELLVDIKALFERMNTDRLTSAEICDSLAGMEDRPWSELKNGKPITPRQVAQLLKPFGITPETHRYISGTAKGYLRTAFDDAFSRYIPDSIGNTVTSSENRELPGNSSETSETVVTDETPPKPAESKDCYPLTDEIPELG